MPRCKNVSLRYDISKVTIVAKKSSAHYILVIF